MKKTLILSLLILSLIVETGSAALYLDTEYMDYAKPNTSFIIFGDNQSQFINLYNTEGKPWAYNTCYAGCSWEPSGNNALIWGVTSYYFTNYGWLVEDRAASYCPNGSYQVYGSFVSTESQNQQTYRVDIKASWLTVPSSPVPPVASFYASPISGSAPLMVQFNDTSIGDIYDMNWSWDFGDGGTSIERNATHTFVSAGTYDVSLTVSNFMGSNTTVKEKYIEVEQPVPEDVKKYAPNLWFEQYEEYYPVDPFFYTNDLSTISGEMGKNTYLSYSLNEKMDKFTVFYHVVDNPSDKDKVYEYWFYYAYNNFINKHYHDWEKVFVFVDRNTGNIDKVIAAAHSSYDPNNILENPGTGNYHPDILVEYGSHATAIDENNNGIVGPSESSEVSNPFKYVFDFRESPPIEKTINWAYQIWGFGNSMIPPYISIEHDIPEIGDYWWKSGRKVSATDSNYHLVELSDDYIKKFNGQSEFPNSPPLGVGIEIPILNGQVILSSLGGDSPRFPWDPNSENGAFTNPDALETTLEDVIWGHVLYLKHTPSWYECPGSIIAVFSDDEYFTFTNAKGYFLINDVTPGIHEVVVNHDGFSPYKQRFLHNGNTSLGVDGNLYLVPKNESFRLEGFVHDNDHINLPDAQVDVYDDQNTHLFTTLTDEDGSYLVTLSEKLNYTVKATGGSSGNYTNITGKAGDLIIQNLTIGIDIPPLTANFTANVTRGKVPLSVAFTDTSTGSIPTLWYWEFGDGTNASGPALVHTYSQAGTYSVLLKVANEQGSSEKNVTDMITVLAPTPPVADFSASPLSGMAPLAVTFTDESTNSPTLWLWSFGDGATSAEGSPTHTYTAAGNYTVRLDAINADGTGTVTKTDFITVSVPQTTIPTTNPTTRPTPRPTRQPLPPVVAVAGAGIAGLLYAMRRR